MLRDARLNLGGNTGDARMTMLEHEPFFLQVCLPSPISPLPSPTSALSLLCLCSVSPLSLPYLSLLSPYLSPTSPLPFPTSPSAVASRCSRGCDADLEYSTRPNGGGRQRTLQPSEQSTQLQLAHAVSSIASRTSPASDPFNFHTSRFIATHASTARGQKSWARCSDANRYSGMQSTHVGFEPNSLSRPRMPCSNLKSSPHIP